MLGYLKVPKKVSVKSKASSDKCCNSINITIPYTKEKYPRMIDKGSISYFDRRRLNGVLGETMYGMSVDTVIILIEYV